MNALMWFGLKLMALSLILLIANGLAAWFHEPVAEAMAAMALGIVILGKPDPGADQ